MSWSSKKLNLMIIVGTLLVVGFLLTSFASYFVSRTSLRSEISLNELPLTSDNIYSEIQRDLMRPILVSSLMATDTFLRDWVIQGEDEELKIINYLKEIQLKYNMITSFFVSEKTRIYYHADGILKKVSPTAERDKWYFRVRDMPRDYEVNLDPDLANKDAMTIFINYRVFDYDGNYIGATGVGLTVNTSKRLIEDYQKKYNRTICFVDKNGELQLSGAEWNKKINNIFQQEHYAQIVPKLDVDLSGSYTLKRDGQIIHTNIRYIDEFNWYLVVEQPEADVIRLSFATLLVNLAVCVGITIIILILVNISVSAYQKRIETLRGIVPICSYCKQIRDDRGYWNKVEAYVSKHTDAQFSHSICPSCIKTHYPEEYQAIKNKREEV